MSDMKCPFCQQELVQDNVKLWSCGNPECRESEHYFGTEKMWQELITTRKALDVAMDALKTIKGKHDPRCAVYHIDEKTAYDALEQINEIKGGSDDV